MRSGPIKRKTPMPPRKAPMPRGSSLSGGSTLRRTGPIKPNPKRKASTFARAFGSKERVLFVKSLPCAVPGCTARDIHNAHTEIGGTGYRANADTICPLCSRHHAEEHQHGTRAFEYRHEIDLRAEAAKTEAAWQKHCATST